MRTSGKVLLLCAAVLSLFSCGKEIKYEPGRGYTAYLPDKTKVGLNQGMYMFWDEADKISVFQGLVNQRYRFTGQTGDVMGFFVKDDTSDPGQVFDRTFALYPYDEATIFDGTTFMFKFPSVQSYRPYSFDAAANLMLAVTESAQAADLKFSNLCGYLRFRLYGYDTVRKITLRGNNGEALAGDVRVSLSAESPLLTVGDGGSASIVLDCGDGIELNPKSAAATPFWFALPPIVFEKGFSIEIENADGETSTISTSKKFSVEPGRMTAMAPLEFNLSSSTFFTSFGVEYNGMIYPAYRIREDFEPSISICVPEDIDRHSLVAHFTETCKTVYVGGVEQQSGVTPNDFSLPLQYRLVASTGDEKTYTVYLQKNARSIACWGDSYSELPFEPGSTIVTNGWPYQLECNLGEGFTVYKGGHSGDRSNEIATRQGGFKLYTAGTFTMPAKAGETVRFYDNPETKYGIVMEDNDVSYGGPDKGFRPERWKASLPMINPVHINGVECILDHTQALGTSVTRTSDGESFEVPSGTEVETYGSRISKTVDVTIIYMGQNGGFDNDYDRLVRQHWAMINHTGSKEYIVFQWHHKVIDGYIPLYDYSFGIGANEFMPTLDRRVHALNMRKRVNDRAVELLLKTGAYATEADIPQKDWVAISKGDWPKSFFKNDNDSHPCEYGAKAIAIVVEDFLKEMGYLYGEQPYEVNRMNPVILDGGDLDLGWK